MSEWATVRKPNKGGFPRELVGYIRVSTDDDRQVLDLQHDALLAAGVEEQASGSEHTRAVSDFRHLRPAQVVLQLR